MPNGREMASPMADLQKRRQAFAARKAGVMEKEQELVAIDNAPTAVVVSGGGGGGQVGNMGYWPSKEEAVATAKQVRALPVDARTKTAFGPARPVAALPDARRAQLAALQEGGGGIADALGPRKRVLDGMPEAAILKFCSRVDATLEATRGRTREVQPPHDESEAWMRQLVADLKEQPCGPAAAEIDYINVCGFVMERDAYDFIRFDLGMLLPDVYPGLTDYDADMQLWSWDDSSFPVSAPPPPPPSPK